MKILNCKLKRFKPMMHNGITEFDASFVQPLTTILACNGAGKSSLLRELTPYPATRTDYDNGSKTITISHEGKTYVLTSDFSNKSGAHSFVRDGVELNPSGTTDVQKDLCEQYFPISNLIYQITCNKFKMCSMGKVERRQLFLSTYPSDLTFVSDRHKKICSQIRDYKAQISMLQSKAMSLKDKLIDKSALEHLYKYKQQLEHISLTLDQDIFICNRAYEDLKKDYIRDDRAIIFSQADQILQEATRLRTVYPEMFDDTPTDTHIKLIEAKVTELTKRIKSILTTIDKTKAEVEDYKSHLSSNTDKEINETKQAIDTCLKAIEVLDASIDPTLPLLTEEECKSLSDQFDEVCRWVEVIHEQDGWLWLPRTMDKAQDKLRQLHMSKVDITSNITYYDQCLNSVELRRKKEANMAYPETCNTLCTLKETVKGIIQRTTEEYNRLMSQRQSEVDKLNRVTLLEDKLIKAMQPSSTAQDEIANLERFISSHRWGFLLLNGDTFLNTINRHPTDIINKLQDLINNSNNHYTQRKHKDALMVLQTKLTTLTSSNIPAKAILEKLVTDRSNELAILMMEHNQLIRDVKQVIKEQDKYQELANLEKWYNEFNEKFSATSKSAIISKQMEFLQMILTEMRNNKLIASEELRKIDTTLREQESYLIRLNDEIEPTIKELSRKLKQWSIVEKALSPNSGIPKVYMVRYINNLIVKVNEYIKVVWDYDMELQYLHEDEPLDFSFPVIFNRTSEIKDISICSDGQKAMIDLAWMLAIINYRGIGKSIPVKLDEIDAALSESHKAKLVGLLFQQMQSGDIQQMFMVNHYVSLYTGLTNCDVICLSETGIILPPVYNEHAVIS